MGLNKFLLLSVLIFAGCRTSTPPSSTTTTQSSEIKLPVTEKKTYRASYTKKADLVHTRLNVSLNFPKKELSGQAAIILRPYFYSTDSLILDAKGMELKEVSLMTLNKRIPLKYSYDSLQIRIKLDRKYSRDESFTVYIDYISRPDLLQKRGSEAIAESRGLYFINHDGKDTERPKQAWTQGETESNSVWFPTIEDPAQRMTQEIYLTVDSSMETLSNGLLLSSTNNYNGTRTDYWKQSLPAAPYLTMIAVGNFAIVRENWKNIELSYYVDPAYEKYAKLVFGKTPEMMSFFSDLLGIPFVWEKYAQIVVHDYISGAMENTTAVVHGTNMHQDPRTYADNNDEEYISHELFHQWFGNLVTCESWSNITLNEGLANYSEYLWREHAYGKEIADYYNQLDQATYQYSVYDNDPPLIRYEYENAEDLYDAISYNKGGRVLHMLRSYVGDDAFFRSLHDYLASHMFSSVEIEDLRLAFEKTTGQDLHWFFDQWYMHGGYPVITIDYSWSDSLKSQTITLQQVHSKKEPVVYRIPLEVHFYLKDSVKSEQIVFDQEKQSFTFPFPSKPSLVNIDAKKTLLCTKTDNKTNEELLFQYSHAPLYLDRYEAVSKIGASYRNNTPESAMLLKALNDSSFGIRLEAIQNIGEIAKSTSMDTATYVESELIRLAKKDPVSDVRASALTAIGKHFSYQKHTNVFLDALKDSSYRVNARAFKIISEKDSAAAYNIAARLESDSSSSILSRLAEYYSDSKEDKTEFFKRALRLSDLIGRYYTTNSLEQYIINNPSPVIKRKGIELIVAETKRPQVSYLKSTCIGSLEQIEKSLGKRLTALQGADDPGGRNSASIRDEISELSMLKKYVENELEIIEKL